MPATKRVLSYGDVLLREEDLALLEGPEWLNDQVIAFFFEYLQRERGPSLLALPPATAFLLMQLGRDAAAEILAPLQPAQRGLALLPVNDNPDVQMAAGGSHWSLLVYHRPTHTFRHYDSSPGGNARHARRLAAAVGGALGGNGGRDASPAAFVEVDVPPQSNGYDCGMYVLVLAQAVCGWWRRQQCEAQEGVPSQAAAAAWDAYERELRTWLTPARVAAMRGEVLQLVRDLAAAEAGGGG